MKTSRFLRLLLMREKKKRKEKIELLKDILHTQTSEYICIYMHL